MLQLKKPYHSRHDALKNSSCHVEKVARCEIKILRGFLNTT
jgi:hypothetical protein